MKLCSSLFLLIFSLAVFATPSETHQFHIFGKVTYRCYGGYGKKKVNDEVTKRPCDNKTYDKIVIDKIIPIDIIDEPDPEDSKELSGYWNEKFDFQGRKFEIAITLFKNPATNPYRLRLIGEDNEPTSRKTAVFTEMKSLTEMNPLSLDYSSVGKKEEIRFWVEVKSSPTPKSKQ